MEKRPRRRRGNGSDLLRRHPWIRPFLLGHLQRGDLNGCVGPTVLDRLGGCVDTWTAPRVRMSVWVPRYA
jgi:hypothetical protein